MVFQVKREKKPTAYKKVAQTDCSKYRMMFKLKRGLIMIPVHHHHPYQ